MITQDCVDVNSVETDESLRRQIQIKTTQLEIARHSNMHLVAETLQQQLDELDKNRNFNALMTLFDD
ncbi:hypothetical protein DSM106972_064410 [Dulcicalothrix desertica PCC 7102]|jgi:hypothetical protein|uniref:Uncharacterized protein n=1 Tax=Dulcicalothrix desertica PCC 7102 TaxID=232991 RepID=A0A433V6Y8_9CYAN|nr:hypothetical protein [Dulcicalothrix desertica]RUT01818.1 hypothetical protein DSM106972_064410 [Dulcicalothrix desertica PCC 7102]TWH42972.1 hypothetical protein CAL7102_06659 [Dulcicalothrix desertica PCC 7102]